MTEAAACKSLQQLAMRRHQQVRGRKERRESERGSQETSQVDKGTYIPPHKFIHCVTCMLIPSRTLLLCFLFLQSQLLHELNNQQATYEAARAGQSKAATKRISHASQHASMRLWNDRDRKIGIIHYHSFLLTFLSCLYLCISLSC